VQVTRPEARVVEVEREAARLGGVSGREGLGPQRARGVRHLDERRGGEGRRDGQRQPATGAAEAVAAEGLRVGAVVAGDHQRHEREPVPAHQDRAGEEDTAVEHLHEEQGGDPQRHRRGDHDRLCLDPGGEQARAQRRVLDTAGEAPVQRQQRAA
jgi:hypothetical protein